MRYSIKHTGLISGLILALLVAVGCSKEADRVGVRPASIPPNEIADSATTNASPVKSDITQQQQSNQMPMPGQANDHSTLDPRATQKNQKTVTP
jgi:hypothetical protein